MGNRIPSPKVILTQSMHFGAFLANLSTWNLTFWNVAILGQRDLHPRQSERSALVIDNGAVPATKIPL